MVFHKKTVRDVPVDGSTILVRVNYDLPLDIDGKIADDLWIRSSLPTIEYLLDRDCKVIVVSHFGKPLNRDKKYSLEPAAARLAQLLQRDIRFVGDVTGDRVLQAIKRSPKKGVVVLENLRFHSGEEINNLDFARDLIRSTGARYFVQDSIGVANNKFASTDAISLFVPSVAGITLEADYNTILRTIELTGSKNKINLPGVDVLLDAGR